MKIMRMIPRYRGMIRILLNQNIDSLSFYRHCREVLRIIDYSNSGVINAKVSYRDGLLNIVVSNDYFKIIKRLAENRIESSLKRFRFVIGSHSN